MQHDAIFVVGAIVVVHCFVAAASATTAPTTIGEGQSTFASAADADFTNGTASNISSVDSIVDSNTSAISTVGNNLAFNITDAAFKSTPPVQTEEPTSESPTTVFTTATTEVKPATKTVTTTKSTSSRPTTGSSASTKEHTLVLRTTTTTTSYEEDLKSLKVMHAVVIVGIVVVIVAAIVVVAVVIWRTRTLKKPSHTGYLPEMSQESERGIHLPHHGHATFNAPRPGGKEKDTDGAGAPGVIMKGLPLPELPCDDEPTDNYEDLDQPNTGVTNFYSPIRPLTTSTNPTTGANYGNTDATTNSSNKGNATSTTKPGRKMKTSASAGLIHETDIDSESNYENNDTVSHVSAAGATSNRGGGGEGMASSKCGSAASLSEGVASGSSGARQKERRRKRISKEPAVPAQKTDRKPQEENEDDGMELYENYPPMKVMST